MSIEDRIKRKARSLTKEEIPGYFLPLAIVFTALLFTVTLIRIGIEDKKPQATTPPTTYAIGGSASTADIGTSMPSSPTDAEEVTVTPTVTSLPVQDTTTMIAVTVLGQGTKKDIPKAAYDVVIAASKARISGDGTGIPVSPVAPAFMASGSITDDVVIDVSLLPTSTDINLYFDVRIDPDGPPGTQGNKYLDIHVANIEGIWTFVG